MRPLKASILEQKNTRFRTELSIVFQSRENPEYDVFSALPEVLLDVPHEVFRGMRWGRPGSYVATFWLARTWGQS